MPAVELCSNKISSVLCWEYQLVRVYCIVHVHGKIYGLRKQRHQVAEGQERDGMWGGDIPLTLWVGPGERVVLWNYVTKFGGELPLLVQS